MKTLTNWNIIIVDNCSNVGCDKITLYNNCKSHKAQRVTLYLKSQNHVITTNMCTTYYVPF